MSSQLEVKIYVRNSKKYGKILTIPSQISGSQLYRLAAASQNLSLEQIHLILAGQTLSIETELITLKEKAIVHLINLNQVNSPSIQLNIRTLFGNINPITIQTSSDSSIRDFIDNSLQNVYGERSDKLLLVHIGRQLNPSKTFREELIQNNSELICANLQEIKNRKLAQNQAKQSIPQNISLPIRDLQVPEQPKDMYVQPNFTIAVPQQVDANNNLQLIFDSKARHATSLPNCNLQPEEIIPEEDLNTKLSEDIREENQKEEEQNNRQEQVVVEQNTTGQPIVELIQPIQPKYVEPTEPQQENYVQSVETNIIDEPPLVVNQIRDNALNETYQRQIKYIEQPQRKEWDSYVRQDVANTNQVDFSAELI